MMEQFLLVIKNEDLDVARVTGHRALQDIFSLFTLG